MAGVKISELPPGTASGAAVVPATNAAGNVTEKIPLGSIAALATNASQLTSGTVAYARLPVGTTASTVCAGDDARLTNARTPADGSVTTAKLADANVTYAKIQNVSATDRLLGRASSGAGAVEEIVCTAFGRSSLACIDAGAGRTNLGAAPAASPTFSGTATFEGVILADDSASLTAPVYSFTGDENCGIAHPAVDTVSLVTNQTQRVRVRADGNIGVGYDGASNHRFGIAGNVSQAGPNVVYYAYATAQPGVTSVYGQWAQSGVAEGADLALLYNFYAVQGVFTGTVHTQAGFVVDANLVDATFNFGFRGRMPSGTGRWNLYIDGSANNYLAGNTGLGIATPSSLLHVNGVITVAATVGVAGDLSPSLTFSGDPNTGFGQVSGQSDTASIFTAGHERLRVRATGAVRFVPLAADPAGGVAGDVYYNSSTNKLKVYNGTSWVDLH